MSEEQLKEEVQNPELVEKIADELYSKYSNEVGGVAFNGDALPSWSDFRAHPDKKKQSDAWIEVAKLTIQRLYPTAQSSALPNDALHGSLGATQSAEQGKEEPVGGVVATDADK